MTTTDIPHPILSYITQRDELTKVAPSVTAEEAAALSVIEEEFDRWSKGGTGYHPSQRSATRRKLQDKMNSAKDAEVMKAVQHEIALFDSTAEDVWQMLRRKRQHAAMKAAEIILAALRRERVAVAAAVNKARLIDLSAYELSPEPLLRRAEAMLAAFDDQIVTAEHTRNLSPLAAAMIEYLGHALRHKDGAWRIRSGDTATEIAPGAIPAATDSEPAVGIVAESATANREPGASDDTPNAFAGLAGPDDDC
jgi:hypothetical protein